MDANIIVVEQKPIIKYSLLKQISEEVSSKIEALDIDNIDANEDTVRTIKRTRTELGKEFKTLEEQRKMVKEIVLKDYNEFEDAYKSLIATHYKDADIKLKMLVSSVEDKILQKKIDGIKEYFNTMNTYDFIRFEDLGLKIIKSRSDKSIKEEIDAYLEAVTQNIETIKTLSYPNRVLAKYEITKDLNSAISQTNIEMQREEEIKKRKEERERLAKEEQEKREAEAKQQTEAQQEAIFDTPENDEPPAFREPEPTQEQVFKTSFFVKGTKTQLKKLKAYIINEGIKIL